MMTYTAHGKTKCKRIVALVGATGKLGTSIGHAVLDKPNMQLNALIRPGSRESAARLEQRGAQVVEGKMDTDATLAALSQGATSAISALQGGPDLIINGHTRLLREHVQQERL
jgi:uncharacterized protein YbjT (DUF2867 family)